MNRLRKAVTKDSCGRFLHDESTHTPQILVALPFSISEKALHSSLESSGQFARHLLPFLVQKRVESPCWSLGNKRMVQGTGHSSERSRELEVRARHGSTHVNDVVDLLGRMWGPTLAPSPTAMIPITLTCHPPKVLVSEMAWVWGLNSVADGSRASRLVGVCGPWMCSSVISPGLCE